MSSAAECTLIFKDMHTCLRKLADEIGTFMVNEKDRLHSDKIPNLLPMAYIMKRKSLPTNDLRFLVDECQKDLDN